MIPNLLTKQHSRKQNCSVLWPMVVQLCLEDFRPLLCCLQNRRSVTPNSILGRCHSDDAPLLRFVNGIASPPQVLLRDARHSDVPDRPCLSAVIEDGVVHVHRKVRVIAHTIDGRARVRVSVDGRSCRVHKQLT